MWMASLILWVECGKVYIGKTGRGMTERVKENERDIRLARTHNSAVSEHANETSRSNNL